MLQMRTGPYQVQAAIAALHARAVGQRTSTGLELISSTLHLNGCSHRL
jgi:predicted RNA polymerase sigma factor